MSWGKVMDRTDWAGAPGVVAALCVLAALAAAPASAADDHQKASPRTEAEIGGASVVLVTANDRLYAFIDRVEDNAPVTDATLRIGLSDGLNLKLAEVAGGMFVAPYDHTGHARDLFVVTLASVDGSGEARPAITYDDGPAAEAASPSPRPASAFLSMALPQMSVAFAAVLALSLAAVARARRRRLAPAVSAADVA